MSVIGLEKPASVTAQLTDSKGRFAFTGLETPARYYVRAARTGYIDGAHGSELEQSALGSAIQLESGDWFNRAAVRLSKAGGISGIVRDPNGEAVVGAFVRVMREVYVRGRSYLAAGFTTTTDDRGFYLIGNLPPGQYLVAVPSLQMSGSQPVGSVSRGGQSEPRVITDGPLAGLSQGYPIAPVGAVALVYPSTYFPGVRATADASRVDLSRGAEISGIDFRLLPTSAFRVSGTLTGLSAKGLTVSLLPLGDEVLGTTAAVAMTAASADGTFNFPAVPAGEYVLVASSFAASVIEKPAIFSTHPVGMSPPVVLSQPTNAYTTDLIEDPARTVALAVQGESGGTFASGRIAVKDRDLSGVVVDVRRTSHLAGVARLDVSGGLTLPRTARIVAEPCDGNPNVGVARSYVDTAGAFSIVGLLPAAYCLTVEAFIREGSTNRNVRIRTIQVGDEDRTDQAIAVDGQDIQNISITLTLEHSRVEGTLARNGAALTPSTAAVVYFPVDQAAWNLLGLTSRRIGYTVAIDGRFAFDDVPPGEYLLAATSSNSLTSSNWQDQATWQSLVRAAQLIRVVRNETTQVSLRLQ